MIFVTHQHCIGLSMGCVNMPLGLQTKWFCVIPDDVCTLSGARLTKAYDAIIQRYRNSHAKKWNFTPNFEPIYRNSKDVDALKFQLVRHDIFYNGQNQKDSTEYLLMLINIIHKGSMPDSSSTTSSTGDFLSDILFSFALEKYTVCDVCGLRSPLFESSSVLYISPTDTSSMQNLILEGLQQKLQKCLFSMQ